VSNHIRCIEFDSLWDLLCEALDIVRDLEGIADYNSSALDASTFQGESAASSKVTSTGGAGGGVGGGGAALASASTTSLSSMANERAGASNERASSTSAAADENMQMSSLSSLTMRFMPLIECYLTECSATLLRRSSIDAPSLISSADVGSSSSSSSSSASSVPQTPSVSGQKRRAEGTGSSPLAGAEKEAIDPVTASSITPLYIPGGRFRQHKAFLEMQMELEDSPAAVRLITFAEKNKLLLNMALKNHVQLLETSFSPLIFVPRCRQLLHFDNKRAYFKNKLKKMKTSATRHHEFSGQLHITVRRQSIFHDSFASLRDKSADEMRRKLAVHFDGEEGMDAGGLTREWFSVLAKEIFNPNYALFTTTGDNVTFQPFLQSFVNKEHLQFFKFVGRVIGKALCDGHLFDAHFTRSFYKHMLGLPVNFHDLESIEPDYYKSLKQILDTPLDLLGLDLTFAAESNDFGEVKVVDLVEGGREIAVTDDNKYEYVRLIAHHRMTTAIRTQIDSFLEGFHELIPPEFISIFDAQELELLISGLPDIDLDDLRAHTGKQAGRMMTACIRGCRRCIGPVA
jgi:E3 ubiquitin-protein ligase HUWE1